MLYIKSPLSQNVCAKMTVNYRVEIPDILVHFIHALPYPYTMGGKLLFLYK